MNKVTKTQEEQHQDYVNNLTTEIKLRWNVLLGALKLGRTAKFDHMDVLEANHSFITVGDKESGKVNMTFKKEDILKPGNPQIDHFEIRYFNDKGVELKNKNPSDMDTKGAKPLNGKRIINDHSPGF